MTPQRIQVSRRRGFNLQAASIALNGLPAVKVDRTTKWGNPYRIGHPGPHGMVADNRRHSWQLYGSTVWSQTELVRMVRAELAGKNLACWCPPARPYEADECHAAVLLVIANPTIEVHRSLAALMGWPWTDCGVCGGIITNDGQCCGCKEAARA